jgi:RNA-directed DNA polymerase
MDRGYVRYCGDERRSHPRVRERNRKPSTLLAAKLMAEIASETVLEQAYRWLCDRRKRYCHNNDVWTLRWRWSEVKAQVQADLLSGCYRFEAMDRIPQSEDDVALWSSRDALVLKAMAIVLTGHLAPRLPKSCYHLVGNGGSKAAVRYVASRLRGQTFVFRTDVNRYYASIDHDILFAQLKQYIADPGVLDLLWQYLRRMVYDEGLYQDVTCGIPMGCPLSPLMGAIYLVPLDERMAQCGVCYIRFMDDWVVLAPTRWKLRAAVRCVNQTLAELKMEQHPDKTFVGRISRGFDFLGYRLAPAGVVGVAWASVHQCVERISRLYEQGADAIRIGQYVVRWWTWVRSGMGREFTMTIVAEGLAGRQMAIAAHYLTRPPVAAVYGRRLRRTKDAAPTRATRHRVNVPGSGMSCTVDSKD